MFQSRGWGGSCNPSTELAHGSSCLVTCRSGFAVVSAGAGAREFACALGELSEATLRCARQQENSSFGGFGVAVDVDMDVNVGGGFGGSSVVFPAGSWCALPLPAAFERLGLEGRDNVPCVAGGELEPGNSCTLGCKRGWEVASGDVDQQILEVALATGVGAGRRMRRPAVGSEISWEAGGAVASERIVFECGEGDFLLADLVELEIKPCTPQSCAAFPPQAVGATWSFPPLTAVEWKRGLSGVACAARRCARPGPWGLRARCSHAVWTPEVLLFLGR